MLLSRGLAVAFLFASVLSPVAASAAPCAAGQLSVPGAEYLIGACLTDLTTTGTGPSHHTDPADWAGLEAPGTVTPSGVPGIQLDGYFPDSSKTNQAHGWNHDSQFVIRLPDHWNGGLVVAGPPATRRQYANDRIIGDGVLAKGYAFAATDKGNTGPEIYKDGRRPGDAIAEWHRRVAQLTVAAKKTVAQRYGRVPSYTYAAGLSAGGYLVRWQLEHYPRLYTGGLDWNALVFTDEHSLLTTLPPALRAYQRLTAGDPEARKAMTAAGYPAATEPLWAWSYANQWDFFQRILREEIDPDYDGATEAGSPFCPVGTGPGCDTDYDFAKRPMAVHRAVKRVSLTGRISRPLISIHGTLDALAPISQVGDVYDNMVADAGRSGLHRYYRITGGTHTDGLAGAFPALIHPMLPDFQAAFAQLEAWTQQGIQPPPS